MAQSPISEETLKIDCGANNRSIFAQKVSKETERIGQIRRAFKDFVAKLLVFREPCAFKIRLLQCYVVV